MTTPTTQLQAVNSMLSTIGEAPVNSLSSGLVDAETAETVLNEVSRDVQLNDVYHVRIGSAKRGLISDTSCARSSTPRLNVILEEYDDQNSKYFFQQR